MISVQEQPLVSVVVPTYRAGSYLIELCAALAAQTHRRFEVFILSDGCDDHSQPALHPYADDPRFNIESWQPNRGVASATRHLLEKVRGEFWCYPGADDLLHPEFFAHRLEAAAQMPEANVIFGAGIQIDEAGNEIWYHPARVVSERLARFDRAQIDSRRMLRLLLQDNVVNTPSVFCRSAATLPTLLAADVPWRYAQDYHYWILLAAAGAGFGYDARPLHSYRMHHKQMSRDPAVDILRLAEFRLVPLVALGQASRISRSGAESWQEWRKDLYALWVVRAASLLRRNKFHWQWQRRAAAAYHGRAVGSLRAFADMVQLLPCGIALHRDESCLATRQVWVNALRKIDDPIFRATDEG